MKVNVYIHIAVGPVTQKELLTKDLWICCVLSVCVCVCACVCVCVCVRACVCVRWLCSRYSHIHTQLSLVVHGSTSFECHIHTTQHTHTRALQIVLYGYVVPYTLVATCSLSSVSSFKLSRFSMELNSF